MPDTRRTVATGSISVPYSIYENHMEDGVIKYDWYDSDELYDTIEEAVQAFRDSIGG